MDIPRLVKRYARARLYDTRAAHQQDCALGFNEEVPLIVIDAETGDTISQALLAYPRLLVLSRKAPRCELAKVPPQQTASVVSRKYDIGIFRVALSQYIKRQSLLGGCYGLLFSVYRRNDHDRAGERLFWA